MKVQRIVALVLLLGILLGYLAGPLVSFGKERPLDPAATPEAYAKNRRAHFALVR